MQEILSNELIFQLALIIILISLVIIALSVFIILNKKRTVEEKKAQVILDTLRTLKEGKTVTSTKPAAPKLEIKKEESSLKAMLIKKFKPKIEAQLSSKVTVFDFNAKEENFLVLVEVSGVRLLLTLDSSGKILDYKKVKQN